MATPPHAARGTRTPPAATPHSPATSATMNWYTAAALLLVLLLAAAAVAWLALHRATATKAPAPAAAANQLTCGRVRFTG